MNTKLTLNSYSFELEELETLVESLQNEIKFCKKRLLDLESKLIGAKEQKRKVKENLRLMNLSIVKREVSSREVEIAAMKGLEFQLGEEYTKYMQKVFMDTPALPRFKNK